MKTRTSLVAAATATAVAISGASVAEAAPTVVDNGTTTAADEGSSIRDMDPGEIRDWIAVITAILRIISQVASVATKFVR